LLIKIAIIFNWMKSAQPCWDKQLWPGSSEWCLGLSFFPLLIPWCWRSARASAVQISTWEYWKKKVNYNFVKWYLNVWNRPESHNKFFFLKTKFFWPLKKVLRNSLKHLMSRSALLTKPGALCWPGLTRTYVMCKEFENAGSFLSCNASFPMCYLRWM